MYKRQEFSVKLRVLILLLCLITISFSLFKGIYGSFLFVLPVPIIWQVCIRGDSFAVLGFRRRLLVRSVFVGILSGIALGLIGGWLFRLFFNQQINLSQGEAATYAIGNFKTIFSSDNEIGFRLLRASHTSYGLFSYLLFMIFVIGLGEELFWRGFIQQKIAMMFTKHPAIFFTCLIFTLFHVYLFSILSMKEGVFLLFLIFLAGLFWGYLYERYRNIWAPAFSHGIAAFMLWRHLFFVGQ